MIHNRTTGIRTSAGSTGYAGFTGYSGTSGYTGSTTHNTTIYPYTSSKSLKFKPQRKYKTQEQIFEEMYPKPSLFKRILKFIGI